MLPFKTQHAPYPDMLHVYAKGGGVMHPGAFILFFEKKRIKRNFLRETLFRLWGKGERCMKCPVCGREMETWAASSSVSESR